MKASINHAGLLMLEPETPLEAYAVHKWAQDNLVVTSAVTGQDAVWKGSGMIISANVEVCGSPH